MSSDLNRIRYPSHVRCTASLIGLLAAGFATADADRAHAASYTFLPNCSLEWHTVCPSPGSGCSASFFKFQNNWGWIDPTCRPAYIANAVYPGAGDDVDLGVNAVTLDAFAPFVSVRSIVIPAGGSLANAGHISVTAGLENFGELKYGLGNGFAGALHNHNRIYDPDSGQSRAGDGATVTNDGLIELTGSGWHGNSGVNSLLNNGEFRKTSSGGFAPIQGFLFTNAGLVSVQQGTLRFRNAPSLVTSLASGTWSVANAARLDFHDLALAGDMHIDNLGTAAVFNTISVPASGLRIETIGNALLWDGAVLNNDPSATLQNKAASRIDMNGGASLNNGGFHNLGTVTTGTFGLAWVLNNHTFTNDGVLEFHAGQWNAGAGVSRLINNGTLRKTTTDFVNIQSLPLTNAGLLDVQAGTLRIRGGDFTAGNAAGVAVAAGARLEFYEGNSSGEMHLSGTLHGTSNGQIGLGAGLSNFTVAAPGLTLDVGGNGIVWEGGGIDVPPGLVLTNAATGVLRAQAGGAGVGGTLVNNGQWTQAGDRNCTDHTFINNGTMIWESGQWSGNTGGSLFINHGTIRKTTNSYAFWRGAFDVRNDGELIVEEGCFEVPGTYLQTDGVTRLAGGCLPVGGGATVVFAGGRLEGSGNVGNINVTGATVAPGLSAGNLHVAGNYTQGADAKLEIEIGGLTAGTEFDRVQVDGTATLAGALDIQPINGFGLQAGQSFVILTAASVTGQFATVNCPQLYQVEYNPTNVTVRIGFTPGACMCVPDVDTDADGTLDCNDGCPNDPAKTSPGACGCGAPDADDDGDGAANCVDGCPADAAKTAAGDCGCGAADADADGNGISDCLDDGGGPGGGPGSGGDPGTGGDPNPDPGGEPNQNPTGNGSPDCGIGAGCGAGVASLFPIMAISLGGLRRRMRPRR